MKKYNLSEIMKRAWELVKKAGATISAALKEAWKEAKNMAEKIENAVIDTFASYNTRRYSLPYSRANGANDPYAEYMDSKQSYRNGKSEDCKRRMLAALEEHMDALTEELGDLSKDADCREERETISRYMDKLRKMM